MRFDPEILQGRFEWPKAVGIHLNSMSAFFIPGQKADQLADNFVAGVLLLSTPSGIVDDAKHRPSYPPPLITALLLPPDFVRALRTFPTPRVDRSFPPPVRHSLSFNISPFSPDSTLVPFLVDCATSLFPSLSLPPLLSLDFTVAGRKSAR